MRSRENNKGPKRMTRSRSAAIAASAALSALLLSCGKGENVPTPPYEGQCGMRGQRVWCNNDWDPCFGNACDLWGNCWHSWPNYYRCTLPWGSPCGDEYHVTGEYCNMQGYCSNLCETHEDCPGGTCYCTPSITLGVNMCHYYRCRDGACPPGTEEVKGTLACRVKTDYLEGDCHVDESDTCDASYIPVGTRGCVRIDT